MKIEHVKVCISHSASPTRKPLTETIPVQIPTELHEAVKMVGGPDKLMHILEYHLITVARSRKRKEMMAAAEKLARTPVQD